jgi:hypothetical protein
MASKKKRQTMEKMRREQAVRKRREDKLQRKADMRAAKTAAALGETAPESSEAAGDDAVVPPVSDPDTTDVVPAP